jgi:hypothetical protein
MARMMNFLPVCSHETFVNVLTQRKESISLSEYRLMISM